VSEHQHQATERPWRNCDAPLEPLPDSDLVFAWRPNIEIALGPTPPRPVGPLTEPRRTNG
jgi:hypothetical protein